MRTTLDIADDVLAVAKDLARAEGKTLGKVISDLARSTLTAPSAGSAGFAKSGEAYGLGAWPALPNRQGVVVTTGMIERIEEQLDREDASVEDSSLVPAAPSRSKPGHKRGTGR